MKLPNTTNFIRTIRKCPSPLFSVLSVSLNIRPGCHRTQFSTSIIDVYDHTNSYAQHYPDAFSQINSLIVASSRVSHLNQIHAKLTSYGFSGNEILISKFIDTVLSFGETDYALKVFDEMPQPSVFTWNAIVGWYCKRKMLYEAVEMYVKIYNEGLRPDSFTFTKVLKGCGDEKLIDFGEGIHAQTIKLGFEENVFVQNGLVSFYSKCGSIDHAKAVFNALSYKTVISWTAIISGCAQHGQAMEALALFRKMRMKYTKPDWMTLVSVLRACTDLEYLEQGKSVHGAVIKLGFEYEDDLHISLTVLYAKCGKVIVARYLFDQMSKTSLLLCNAMISGYAKNGYAEEAVELFKTLATKNVIPDSITIRAVILACAQLGLPHMATWMNNYVTKTNFQNQVFVRTALVDMYAKCGNVDLARQEFDEIPEKDEVCWTAMIVGYGLHGQGREAINLFNAMLRDRVKPNDVTFVGLLTACKNSGLVKDGWDFFHSMKEYGIQPRHQHYACVVDLLGRAGYLSQAFKFIITMRIQPGVTVWAALLSACKIYSNVQMAEYAAGHLFSIDPYGTGHYVQLSNLYAATHMWDQVPKVRKLMKKRGLSKDFGYSLIEINGKGEVFRTREKSHPRSEEIWEELAVVENKLKEAGYVTDIESGLHDLSSEDLEESLCSHSERLAIAYGLIATPEGSTLHIIKNLRTCVNCHLAIKLISKIKDREIIVRDANRFHHFKHGVCSCGDYW